MRALEHRATHARDVALVRDFDADAQSIADLARSAKTKDYCGSQLIDGTRRGETRVFIESVYRAICPNREAD